MNDVSEKWKKISTDAIEIMLPETFIGGNPNKDKRTIQEQISHQPEELREIYKYMFKAIKSEFSAVEVHKEQEKNQFMLVSLVVEKIPWREWGTSLESYLEKSLKTLGRNVDIGEKGLVALQNYQAARVVTYVRENRGLFKKPGEINQVLWTYTIKESHRFLEFLLHH